MLDSTYRLFGGVPTYALTDNERTVTDRHIAGIAVLNRTMVDVSAWYGLTIATCVPYDPESKCGSESSVNPPKAFTAVFGVSRSVRGCPARSLGPA